MNILNINTKELSEIEKQKIVDIYFKVFSAPPRKEIINKTDIYKELFNENNYISLLRVNNEIIGFCFSTKIEFFSDFKLIKKINNSLKNFALRNRRSVKLGDYVTENKAQETCSDKMKMAKGCYISVIAILEKNRHNGLGKILLNEHLLYLNQFFSEVYTRSRVDIENVVNLFLSENFKIIKTYESEINMEKSIKNLYFKNI